MVNIVFKSGEYVKTRGSYQTLENANAIIEAKDTVLETIVHMGQNLNSSCQLYWMFGP